MPDLPVFLPLFCMFKEVRRLYNTALAVITIIVNGLNVMEQVIIDVVYTQIVQLAPEGFLNLVFRDHHERRELGRHSKTIPRMPLHKCLPGGLLTLSVMVNKAGVKIGIPGSQKCIHHPVQLIVIKISRAG